jgi:hypothetical protein
MTFSDWSLLVVMAEVEMAHRDLMTTIHLSRIDSLIHIRISSLL